MRAISSSRDATNGEARDEHALVAAPPREITRVTDYRKKTVILFAVPATRKRHIRSGLTSSAFELLSVLTIPLRRMQQLDTQKLGLVLVETARAWRTKLDQRLRPLGLSQGKWTTLVHLAWGGDKLTQRELAARIGIEEATLAGLLDRLQTDGWVERKTSAHDRRCKTVHLQPRSKKVLSKIFETAQSLRQELISDIATDGTRNLHARAGAHSRQGGRRCAGDRHPKGHRRA